MAEQKRSLGQVTATGAVWLLAQSFGGRAVAFLSQLVLAAILSPRDFGVIGLAYTVSAIGATLANFGVDTVLLQRQATIRFWIVPAFWFSFALGMVGLLGVAVVGPFAAQAYGNPDVALLAVIIAVGIPISALGTIPTVVLRARFQFRTLAGIGFCEILAIQGMTIALALAGFGPFAFVIPLPTVALIRTISVWLLARIPVPRVLRGVSRIKYLLSSSIAVFGTSIVQSGISQGGYVVLGLFGNETAVGVYFFAFKMASQPLLLMAMSLSSVLFPALSHLRNSPVEQGAAAIRAARLLALMIMPIAFLQAGLIEPAIHLFFESKWDASIPLMQILSIALGFDAVAWVAGTLVAAQRGFLRQFLYISATAVPFAFLVFLGGRNGSALELTMGIAAFYILITPIYSYVVFRSSTVGIGPLIVLYLRPAALAAIGVGAAVLLAAMLGINGDIPRIIAISALGLATYAVLLRLFDASGFAMAMSLVKQMLARGQRVAA